MLQAGGAEIEVDFALARPDHAPQEIPVDPQNRRGPTIDGGLPAGMKALGNDEQLPGGGVDLQPNRAGPIGGDLGGSRRASV